MNALNTNASKTRRRIYVSGGDLSGTLEGGRGVFNATPAFDGTRLLVRSSRALSLIHI